MFRSLEREKLLNAILYFVRETRYCNTLKLFKLLHFLDFEHYRQTGRPVTGLQYAAWPMGPVPPALNDELEQPPADLASLLDINKVFDDEDAQKLQRRDFRARRAPDLKYFTKRELAIMERVAFFFKDLRAQDISEYSHRRNAPWHRVYRQQNKPRAPIPYAFALDDKALLEDEPTIEREELEYRNDVLRETNSTAA